MRLSHLCASRREKGPLNTNVFFPALFFFKSWSLCARKENQGLSQAKPALSLSCILTSDIDIPFFPSFCVCLSVFFKGSHSTVQAGFEWVISSSDSHTLEVQAFVADIIFIKTDRSGQV